MTAMGFLACSGGHRTGWSNFSYGDSTNPAGPGNLRPGRPPERCARLRSHGRARTGRPSPASPHVLFPTIRFALFFAVVMPASWVLMPLAGRSQGAALDGDEQPWLVPTALLALAAATLPGHQARALRDVVHGHHVGPELHHRESLLATGHG